MADPVSVIASAITIAGTAANISLVLFKVAQTAKNAPKDIAEIAQEVSTLSRSLMMLADAIEMHKWLCKPELFYQTESILSRFKQIEKELNELTTGNWKLHGWRWILKSFKAKGLMKKIESMKSALALELNIIQLAKEEIRKDQAKKMTELLLTTTNYEKPSVPNKFRRVAESAVQVNRLAIDNVISDTTYQRDDSTLYGEQADSFDTAAWLYNLIFAVGNDRLLLRGGNSTYPKKPSSEPVALTLELGDKSTPSSNSSRLVASKTLDVWNSQTQPSVVVDRLLMAWTTLSAKQIEASSTRDTDDTWSETLVNSSWDSGAENDAKKYYKSDEKVPDRGSIRTVETLDSDSEFDDHPASHMPAFSEDKRGNKPPYPHPSRPEGKISNVHFKIPPSPPPPRPYQKPVSTNRLVGYDSKRVEWDSDSTSSDQAEPSIPGPTRHHDFKFARRPPDKKGEPFTIHDRRPVTTDSFRSRSSIRKTDEQSRLSSNMPSNNFSDSLKPPQHGPRWRSQDQGDVEMLPSYPVLLFPLRNFATPLLSKPFDELKTSLASNGIRYQFVDIGNHGITPEEQYDMGCSFFWDSPMCMPGSELGATLWSVNWEPLWFRGSDQGRTYFLGTSPVHAVFFEPSYLPQWHHSDGPSNTEYVAIAKTLVRETAIQEMGLMFESNEYDEYILDSQLTAHEVKALVERTLLMREIKDRASHRRFKGTPIDQQSNSDEGYGSLNTPVMSRPTSAANRQGDFERNSISGSGDVDVKEAIKASQTLNPPKNATVEDCDSADPSSPTFPIKVPMNKSTLEPKAKLSKKERRKKARAAKRPDIDSW